MTMKRAIGSICCSIAQATESCQLILPSPPICQRVVSGPALREVLRPISNGCPIFVGDYDYELPPLEEYQRFLNWFNSKFNYTGDNWNCENFSLELWYFMSRWSEGKSPSGHVYAQGSNKSYNFPNHGFNFVIDENLVIAYCDELQLAAPHDSFFKESEVDYHKFKMEII